jgi:hypothetical protein
VIYANGLYGNDHDILALLIDIDCRRLMRIGTSSGEFRDLFMPFVLMSSPSAFNSCGEPMMVDLVARITWLARPTILPGWRWV